MTTTIFTIPQGMIGSFEKKVATLQKRARKIGLPELKISADFENPTGTREVPVDDNRKHNIEIPTYTATVSGEIPAYEGWKVAATIELDGEQTYIYNLVDDFQIPGEYKDSLRGQCEHCNTNRQRKKLVIIAHTDGRIMQVGRSCLKDFLDSTVERELGFAEFITKLADDFSEWDEDYLADVPSYYREVTTATAFAKAAACIRVYGFVKSAELESTKGLMELLLVSTAIDGNTQALRKATEITDADQKLAEDTINWVIRESEKNPNNEFFWNLSQIAQRGSVQARRFGFVAGAVAAYIRDQERAKNAVTEFADSYINAEPKKRMQFNDVKVHSIRTIDGYYGTTTIVTYRTEDGHCLVWFSSNGGLGDIDEVLSIKGTIKEHKLYNGIHQTVINRVKEVV